MDSLSSVSRPKGPSGFSSAMMRSRELGMTSTPSCTVLMSSQDAFPVSRSKTCGVLGATVTPKLVLKLLWGSMSTTATFLPIRARATARFWHAVVLPTPPFRLQKPIVSKGNTPFVLCAGHSPPWVPRRRRDSSPISPCPPGRWPRLPARGAPRCAPGTPRPLRWGGWQGPPDSTPWPRRSCRR